MSDVFVLTASHVIPVRLNIDTRPLSGPDEVDAIWIGNQPIPCSFVGFEDVVIGVPHFGTQSVTGSPRHSPSGSTQVNTAARTAG
jgi:hypothetical protein